MSLSVANGEQYLMSEMLKQKQDMENVPVIFVTGRDISEDQGRAFFSGGADYVTKQLEADAFRRLVTNFI